MVILAVSTRKRQWSPARVCDAPPLPSLSRTLDGYTLHRRLSGRTDARPVWIPHTRARSLAVDLVCLRPARMLAGRSGIGEMPRWTRRKVSHQSTMDQDVFANSLPSQSSPPSRRTLAECDCLADLLLTRPSRWVVGCLVSNASDRQMKCSRLIRATQRLR